MQSLREITQIISRLKTTKLEVVDELPDSGAPDNLSKLLSGIKSGSITSDQKAAEMIYGTTYLDSKYTTLKNRLRNKLLNTLFFLDIKPPEQTVYAEGAYKTYKHTFWVKTLLFLGARQTAIKLAERTLQYAQKFSLTLEAVQLLTDLRYQASLTASKSQYQKYDSILATEVNNLLGEIKVRGFYERIIVEIAKSEEERPDLSDIVRGYLKEMESLTPKPSSFEFTRWYYLVKVIILEICQEYSLAIAGCLDAENYLLQYPDLSSNIRLGEFSVQRLACHLILRQFEEGEKAAQRCRELYRPGTNSWFIFMDNYFMLAMHTGHFTEAGHILIEITSSPRFSFQLDQFKEKLKLYEAYLLFALGTTDKTSDIISELEKFDIKRFLRDVPNYKKDKRGYNISILILQILVLLEQDDFDGIIDRMDALRTYRTRYLQVASNKPSALFFKMLMIMEKCSFDPDETRKKAKKYYVMLLEKSTNSDEISEGLQVLPYEWLWEKIVEMLEEKKKKRIL
jgi:hypothetical protein